MKRLLPILLLFVQAMTAEAQNSDCLTLKDSLTGINCATHDTAMINESLQKLEQLKPDKIIEKNQD